MGRSRWRQWMNAVGPRVTRLKRSDLFDFSPRHHLEAFENWHTWTDQGYGGKSTCSFKPRFEELTADHGDKGANEEGMEGRGNLDDQGNSEGNENGFKVEPNCAVFSGTISKISTRSDVARTGFAAARSHLPWYVQDVSEFEGMAIRFKSDGRRYNINITPESFFSDDLYQGFLFVGPEHENEWVTATLPFENLLLTGQGRIKEYQRVLDSSQLRSIGVSIADSKEGDFRLEIEWIRAVRAEELQHFKEGIMPSNGVL